MGGSRIRGGIFDVDGVLLDTPHERAWREALRQLMTETWARDGALARRTTYTPDAFTSAVYQQVVAGKPREAGARDALAYFGIPDPEGRRTAEYAEVKQGIIERLAAAGDFHAYDDALRFLLHVKEAGVRVCCASSSKNADAFLRGVDMAAFCARNGVRSPVVRPGATLLDLFDADVNGRDVGPGKPDPALFLAAARALGEEPGACFVAEDAPAGVQAARAGGMYAIGVARHDDAASLRAAGADVVVERLDTLPVAQVLGA